MSSYFDLLRAHQLNRYVFVHMKLKTAEFVMWLICLSLFFLSRSLIDGADWRMAKSISLILLMLALIALAMTNYSLSLYLSLAITLPAVLAQPLILESAWELISTST